MAETRLRTGGHRRDPADRTRHSMRGAYPLPLSPPNAAVMLAGGCGVLTWSAASISAFLSRSSRTVSVWPPSAARLSAERPACRLRSQRPRGAARFDSRPCSAAPGHAALKQTREARESARGLKASVHVERRSKKERQRGTGTV